MSNIFSNKKAAKGSKIEEDFVGGGGVLDTDIYPVVLKAVYLAKAASSDAQSLNIIGDINGREFRSNFWVSNRNGDVTYKDKKTGEDKNLPGFNQANSLCMLICGKELGDMEVEELTLKIYDFDAKKELPKAVDCFVELHDQTVNIAIQKQIVDKTEKSDSGSYEPTGETREINEMIKFFPADKLVTISEVAHYIKGLGGDFDEVLNDGNLSKAINKMEDENGNFADKWLDKNKGQVYDKSKGKKGSGEGRSFKKSSGKSGGETKSKANLFDE